MLVARNVSAAPAGGSGPAFRDFSLVVQAGEWVAISGPNGSGKTTLILALAGLRPISSGSLEWEGRPFGPQSPAADRVAVAAVLQEPASQLLESTVAEELRFSAINLGHRGEELGPIVEGICQELGLADLDRDPGTLSAGRQQALLLASALATRPKLLVVDEGGAHLDSTTRRRVLDILRGEVDRGLAVIWVTQEPEELAAADRCVRLGIDDHSNGVMVWDSLGDIQTDRDGCDGPILEVSISPWDGIEPHRVLTHRPLEIEIPSSGIVGLEGVNGSGKTMLLEVLGGALVAPQIRVVWRQPSRAMPIRAGQFPELEIFEEVVSEELVYAAVSRGIERRDALEHASNYLDYLGLEGRAFMERRSWELSAGEKRMVGVIGALIAPCSLLLLDEPTCGLDSSKRNRLSVLLDKTARHVPIVVASQDTEWLQRLSARRIRLGFE